ncbi:MAG: universal stress protein UspA [Desulfobulbus propionicus]|nr:MAG: universal stress protein UspA [Desulfobulbus propionicus]
MVARPDIRTILYASDLGKQTRPVFRLAVSQARRYNAQLLLLHVVAPLGVTGQAIVDTYLSPSESKKVQRDGMERILEVIKERLDKFCKDEYEAYQLNRTPVTEIMVVSGSLPSHEILRVADEHDADMIVMGKSTHGFFGGTLMGTTARRVTRHSNIPVLLVPNSPEK